MPPARKKETKYLLVKWLDCNLGPCRDVVHRSCVEVNPNLPLIEDGQQRVILCGKKKIRRKAVILTQGAERVLKLKRVTEDGVVKDDGPCIPTRRECEHHHALATRRAEAQAASDAVAFQDIMNQDAPFANARGDVEFLEPDEGVPTGGKTVEDVVLMARQLASNPTKDQVRQVLWSLPCLQRGDPQLFKPVVPGINCFINKHIQGHLHRDFQDKKPGLYMSALLHALVPERVLAMPRLTARGICIPGTLGLPAPIFQSVKIFMDSRGMRPKNGWANAVNGVLETARDNLAKGRMAAESMRLRATVQLASENQNRQETARTASAALDASQQQGADNPQDEFQHTQPSALSTQQPQPPPPGSQGQMQTQTGQNGWTQPLAAATASPSGWNLGSIMQEATQTLTPL